MTTATATVPDLITPWLRYKASLHRQHACTSNRASQLGSDCERELVYWRTRWQEAAPPPLDLQIILQEGEKHEREVLIELQRAGVQVIEQQLSLEWGAFLITGHLDATVVHDGDSIPVDVKSMSPHIWDGIFRGGSRVYAWAEVAEAFGRKPWLRKYLAQVNLYALMKGCERGMLLCLNKGTGALAQVVVEIDYEYAESLLRRAERINAHVASGSLPERIAFDEEVCPRCPFYAVCLPEHVGREPIAFLDDRTVEGLLEERAANEEAARSFERADGRFKAWAKARPEERLSIGRWLVVKRKLARGVRVDVEAIEASGSAPGA
jgi:CRISPR/Cas system-associated exonuclease Cas4 (RecB family)